MPRRRRRHPQKRATTFALTCTGLNQTALLLTTPTTKRSYPTRHTRSSRSRSTSRHKHGRALRVAPNTQCPSDDEKAVPHLRRFENEPEASQCISFLIDLSSIFTPPNLRDTSKRAMRRHDWRSSLRQRRSSQDQVERWYPRPIYLPAPLSSPFFPFTPQELFQLVS